MLKRAKRFAIPAILVTLLLIAGYCLLRYRKDQRWLAVQARQITDRAGAHTRREQIVALRDHLRRHVKWRGAAHDDRPFLRATARETLESGLGYCGESTRAFINLAHQLGISAQRVNLYGPNPHVIAEAEVQPGVFILVDAQDSAHMNAYFDRRDWTLDEAARDPGAPFLSYSNLHLRRIPLLSRYATRVRFTSNSLTWVLENPWLIETYIILIVLTLIAVCCLVDRLAIRFYAYRLGVRCPEPLLNTFRPERTEPDGRGSFLPQSTQDDLIGGWDRIASATDILT
jgi:hypothetical protein